MRTLSHKIVFYDTGLAGGKLFLLFGDAYFITLERVLWQWSAVRRGVFFNTKVGVKNR